MVDGEGVRESISRREWMLSVEVQYRRSRKGRDGSKARVRSVRFVRQGYDFSLRSMVIDSAGRYVCLNVNCVLYEAYYGRGVRI
jgi:hypothetical protein